MKTYLRIISLALVLMLTAALVSCGGTSDNADTDTTAAPTDTEAVSDTSAETESNKPDPVPMSFTMTEADFEVTVSTENSVISLADIKSGDVTSLEYKLEAVYISDEMKAIAYFPAICAVTIYDENGNTPFGVSDLMWSFDYAYMEKGDTLEKEITGSYYLDKFEAPGQYTLSVSFEYVTEERYFAEEYQNTPSDVYPTDKQISDGCENYRILVEIPLVITE